MQARALTVRLIRIAMAASLIAPLLLFVYASWASYRSFEALALERLQRSLDIEQEEAVKTFEIIDFTMALATDAVQAMSADDIRRNEDKLYLQFKKLADAVTVVQSIWIYGKDGQALVSSRVHPPPQQSYANRDFYLAHLKGDIGPYYGQTYLSQFNGQPFFTVSRRLEVAGEFVGVLEASILPGNFFQFYSTLAYTEGLQYSLIREDGLFLSRYPLAPRGAIDRLDDSTAFHQTIARDPAGGVYTSNSPVDHVDRRYAVRRFGERPLYLTAGIEISTIRSQWIWAMAAHLIFGIPATLVMFATLYFVLRRTQNLYAEIDRRALAEESLRQSQKLEAIGHLTGGVAHDFNNLLTIIIGNLENAKRQVSTWVDAEHARLARRLENAMHGAERAATLTKRLLAFSRQQPLNPSIVDVNRLMNGLSDFLRRGIGEDISLEVVGSGGLWPVEADAAELESVILNLAVNARDAMPNGGKLTVEGSNSYLDETYCKSHQDVVPGQYVQISVTDTGTGMPKAVIDRAFEPFFTTKASGQGTGLGLSQVYGFVKQSGGHIKIYSEVGEGTTIKVYLRRFSGAAAPIDDYRQESQRAVDGECVLVVEDDGDVRRYVVETLEDLGYDVLQADGADAALGLIDEYHGVRLLLTDVVMPGKNGRKLADEAKSRRPGLKVLFMTGYSRNAIVHQGRLDAGVELVQKPLTSEHLANAVRKVLDQ